MGVYHPHSQYHHIKKENIGLIEVMGLAVLPARLKKEMADLEAAVLQGANLREDEVLEKHADWAEKWMSENKVTSETIHGIVQAEIGKVFAKVLECAGVYKRTEEGMKAFERFIEAIK
jgi:UDPglucose--hexose-1-phosphate uridylyltransferase